jgi:hypothetical protein
MINDLAIGDDVLTNDEVGYEARYDEVEEVQHLQDAPSKIVDSFRSPP